MDATDRRQLIRLGPIALFAAVTVSMAVPVVGLAGAITLGTIAGATGELPSALAANQISSIWTAFCNRFCGSDRAQDDPLANAMRRAFPHAISEVEKQLGHRASMAEFFQALRDDVKGALDTTRSGPHWFDLAEKLVEGFGQSATLFTDYLETRALDFPNIDGLVLIHIKKKTTGQVCTRTAP